MEIPKIKFYDYPPLTPETKNWLRERTTEITAQIQAPGLPYGIVLVVHPARITPGHVAPIEVIGNLETLEDYAGILRSAADAIERNLGTSPKPPAGKVV